MTYEEAKKLLLEGHRLTWTKNIYLYFSGDDREPINVKSVLDPESSWSNGFWGNWGRLEMEMPSIGKRLRVCGRQFCTEPKYIYFNLED